MLANENVLFNVLTRFRKRGNCDQIVAETIGDPAASVVIIGDNIADLANYLAVKGHSVTAVDTSPPHAQTESRDTFNNVKFVDAPAAKEALTFNGLVDVIFLRLPPEKHTSSIRQTPFDELLETCRRLASAVIIDSVGRQDRPVCQNSDPFRSPARNTDPAHKWVSKHFGRFLDAGWTLEEKPVPPTDKQAPPRTIFVLAKSIPTLRRSKQNNFKRYCFRLRTDDLNFLTYPEFLATEPALKGPIQPGNWDQILNGTTVFWSGRYEPRPAHQRGFLPLSDFVFFQSLEERFLHGRPWEETGWFRRMSEVKPLHYETKDLLWDRIRMIEDIYSDFAQGLFKPTLPKDPPIVNFGRRHRIAIEDGRHRLCIAKIAGLREIDVQVKHIHPDAAVTLIDD